MKSLLFLFLKEFAKQERVNLMIIEKDKCCGCSVCANVCPKGCISLASDFEGFLYPEIDNSKCINCGLCRKKCPVLQSNGSDENRIPEAYAVKAKDLELRLSSSSGGAFSLLANYILKKGGVVCGAAMTSDCKSVEHIIIDKQDDLYKLRGSKYVQSNIGSVYKDLLPIIKSGQEVLFSGTPCQIDGLRKFLGKDYDNLLLVEVICHGVPSPEILKNYVNWQERKSGAQIVKIDFRHKKRSWTIFGNRLENSQRKVLYSTLREDPYLLMFLRNYCLRPSCYNCHFKNFKPRADFSLGDFWGVKNVHPDFFDDKGISLVLSHNKTAKNVFEKLKGEMEYKESDCMAALKYNICMLESVKRPKERDTFFEDMNKMDFNSLKVKYASVSFKQKIINRLEMYGLLEAAKRIYKLIHLRK